MATRTRVISQNKAVYVTPTGWGEYAGAGDPLTGNHMVTGHHLHRVDTFSFEMDLAGARQDVREFGQLARIGTVNLNEVNPTLSFGYFLGNGENELALGFTKSVDGAATGQMCGALLSRIQVGFVDRLNKFSERYQLACPVRATLLEQWFGGPPQ